MNPPVPLKHTYSSVTKFETCPRQWAEVKFYKRVKEEQGDAARRGEQGHKALENFLLYQQPFPNEWAWLRDLGEALRTNLQGMHVGVEMELAVNAMGAPCSYNGNDYRIRGKPDLAAFTPDYKTAYVFDFKFGKRKPTDQTQLYAGKLVLNYPTVERVYHKFLWVYHPEANDSGVFVRDRDLAPLWQKWNHRMSAIEHAAANETFPPKPSGLCNGWCPVRTCEFWKPKR
jgi:PD-(D/E)XK nuclease superfamily